MEQAKDQKSKIGEHLPFSDAALIAGASVVLYSIAYQHELGFARYYGIPESLISVSVESVIRGNFSTFGVFLIVALIFLSGSRLLSKRYFLYTLFVSAFIYIFLLLPLLSDFEISFLWKIALGLFTGVFFALVPLVLIAILLKRNEKPGDDKLPLNKRISKEDLKIFTASGYLRERFGLQVGYIILFELLLYSATFAPTIGKYTAQSEKPLYFKANDGSYISMVRRYGDLVVLLRRSTLIATETLVIAPVSEFKAVSKSVHLDHQ